MTRIQQRRAIQMVTICVRLEPLPLLAPPSALLVPLDKLTPTPILLPRAQHALRGMCQWQEKCRAYHVL
jgi:hypothetical protein